MSVATMLGVEDIDAPAMMEARHRWASWVAGEPALAVVSDLLDLPDWTRTADPGLTDDALRALASLGAVDGGDDNAAVTALTWMLVPGAAMVAWRLSDLASNIDELVAAHLWTSAKTFPWRRHRATASAILRESRRGVLAELGVGDAGRRADPTWSRTVCVDPAAQAWRRFGTEPEEDSSVVELLDLLETATRGGVITAADRDLLLALAVAADRVGAPAHRARAGLTVPAASQEVACRRGVSERTVRRRAVRSMNRLRRIDAEKDRVTVSTRAGSVALGA